MTDSKLEDQFLNEFTLNQLASINDIIDHLENSSIKTLSKIFGIKNNNVDYLKNYLRNIIIPKFYINNNQIQRDILDLVNHLDIIQEQIIPRQMINLDFLNSYFYCLQIKNDETKDISIPLTSQNKNKITFLQIIPDGLFYCNNFVILHNDRILDQRMIYCKSYLKINNNGDKIKLSFQNCPMKLLFIQVLFYKKLTIRDISNIIRNKLLIPNDITNFKAKIYHNDHSFKLTQFIDAIQKNNAIICPICKKNNIFVYYNNDEIKEQALKYILCDNEINFMKKISDLNDNDHIFLSKYKMPEILQDGPSFLSLCCFFGSKKCFNSLINYYKSIDKLFMINQGDNNERSPIHFASFNGDLDIISTLIEFDETFDSTDIDGLKPIHYAAMGGKINTIQYFHEKEIDLMSCDNKYCKSPLHFACQYGHLEIIKCYCENIIPNDNFNDFLSSFCPNRITPFHIACKWNQYNIVKYFINHNLAYIQNIFNNDLSPLEYASEYGSLECVKILANKKFNFISCDYQIEKAFSKALIDGHFDIIRFFFKIHSIKISAYHILEAIASDRLEIAKFLVQNNSCKKESYQNIIQRLTGILNHDEISKAINNVQTKDYQENAENDYENSEYDHENSEYDHENSEYDHENSEYDHENSEYDHGNSEYYYENSEYDHENSEYDHGNSEYDHENSEYDHENSEYDHGNSEYYYENSEYDYENSEYYYENSEYDYENSEYYQVKSEDDQEKPDDDESSENDKYFDNSESNDNGIESTDPILESNTNESKTSSVPIPIFTSNPTSNFIPHNFIPCPFINIKPNQINALPETNQLQLMPNLDPSSIGYFKNHTVNGPLTFSDLTKYRFNSKLQVKRAVQNISMIEHKSVHIVKSEQRRLVYKCVKGCNFKITWTEKDGIWFATKQGFQDHTCTYEMAKKPRFHATIIDDTIRSMKLSNSETNTGMTILNHFFGNSVLKKTLKRRLKSCNTSKLSKEQWWQIIPAYLHNNILNGGLSDMFVTNNNEIYSFAMIPQYAKLLLSSNAILPVIIIDGTFQSSIYRGSLIIIMTVSSNRTNIPLGWSWGPSENADSIKLILNLIKEVNEHIETIISDDGKALKAAISEVFPEAVHKLYAWHISKGISNRQVRNIFWQLIRADHPLIFQSIMCKLFQVSSEMPKLIADGRISMFCRFFEGVKNNDLITSSPCESINSDIRKMKAEPPIKVFHFLEIIGYNRCIDLLNITSEMTPYYMKRKEHLETKAQRLEIVEEESYSTSMTIVDPQYPYPEIRWEINTRDYRCPCGKYTDRGFPCAHMVKAFQYLNEQYEQCVHKCYFSSTIKESLKDINSPVSLDIIEKDENLHSFHAHSRECRIKRYLFGFEKSKK